MEKLISLINSFSRISSDLSVCCLSLSFLSDQLKLLKSRGKCEHNKFLGSKDKI